MLPLISNKQHKHKKNLKNANRYRMGLKSICLSVTVVIFVTLVYKFIFSDDKQAIEEKSKEGSEMKTAEESKSSSSESPSKDDPNPFMDYFDNNEMFGGKQLKLYDETPLTHKKAKSFCKKMNGKLARATNPENMRRLQMVLFRARAIHDDVWVGATKKEWRRHSMMMQRDPDYGLDPMMFGGGPTDMCPALSVHTRSLSPVMCHRELPFICEYDPNAPKKPKKSKGKVTTPKSMSMLPDSNKSDNGAESIRRETAKVEMRKKREVILINDPSSQNKYKQQQKQPLAES